MKDRAFAVLGFVSIVCLSLFSATATAEKVQVTDPAMLQRMGLPTDATNVYQVLAEKGNDAAQANSDFGTPQRFTGLPPKAFIGRQNTAANPWEYTGGTVGCCVNLSRSGPETFADAPVGLPDGVSLSAVRFWANDTSAADDMDFFLFETCYPAFGPGPTVITSLISGLATSGSGGNQSDFANPSASTIIDNQNCAYTMRVSFGGTSGLTLQKVRFQWARVISPAPASATFSDVPTSHPFFAAIEALSDAGITTGCTATTFCPNDPLTRGQMAVFLSRALGL